MMFRTALVSLVAMGTLAFGSSAFACGEEGTDKDETEEPSVLCGEEGTDKDETEEPSVLCGEEGTDKDETEEPSVF